MSSVVFLVEHLQGALILNKSAPNMTCLLFLNSYALSDQKPNTVAHPNPVMEADKVDFCSEHFNPLLALNKKDLLPPIPNEKPLDNVGRCR